MIGEIFACTFHLVAKQSDTFFLRLCQVFVVIGVLDVVASVTNYMCTSCGSLSLFAL